LHGSLIIMREQRLTERIRSWNKAPERRGGPDPKRMIDSILRHLRDLERTIRNTIQKYEPRLKSVRVKFIPQEETMLTVSFQIVAQLILDEGKNPVTFQTVMDSDGKVTIKA
jgi:type VI secretion system protein